MKQYFLLIMFFLSVVFSWSCHKNNSTVKAPTTPTVTPVVVYGPMSLPDISAGQAIVLDSFPLAAGHVWHYMVRSQMRSRTFEFLQGMIKTKTDSFSPVDTAYFTLMAFADTTVNSFRFTRMGYGPGQSNWEPFLTYHGLLQTSGATGYGTCYYTNYRDGLHCLGDISTVDTSYVFDTANFLLKLPATSGTSWSENYNAPWDPENQWTGFFKVSVPSGSYNCICDSLSSTWPYYQDYIHHYFSGKGLILSVEQTYIEDRYQKFDEITTTVTSLLDVNF